MERIYSNVYRARKEAAERFEKKHFATIRDHDFTKGRLVLLRNSGVEDSLDRKMKPRYLGPLLVVSRNKGGAYIVCELDGSVHHRPIAAFRLIPYLSRKKLPLPDDFLDIDASRLRELRTTDGID